VEIGKIHVDIIIDLVGIITGDHMVDHIMLMEDTIVIDSITLIVIGS